MTVGGPLKRSSSAPALVADDWDLEIEDMARDAPDYAKWSYCNSPRGAAAAMAKVMGKVMGAQRTIVEEERESCSSTNGRTTPTTDMSSMSQGVNPHVVSAQYSNSLVSAMSSAHSVSSGQASHLHDVGSAAVSTQSTPRKQPRGLNMNAAPFVPSGIFNAPQPQAPPPMQPQAHEAPQPQQKPPSPRDVAQVPPPQPQQQQPYPQQPVPATHVTPLNPQAFLPRQGSGGTVGTPPQQLMQPAPSSPYQQQTPPQGYYMPQPQPQPQAPQQVPVQQVPQHSTPPMHVMSPRGGAFQSVASPTAAQQPQPQPVQAQQQPQQRTTPPAQPQPAPVQQTPRQQRGNKRRGSRTRSKLMEEYRSTSSTRNWDLADIKGHVVEFALDQEGSRLIQRKIEHCTFEERCMVHAEVLPSAINLMQDVFGNYVVQKLIQHGDAQQKRGLVDCLKGNMLSLSTHTYGCRTVQKAFEVMPQPDRDAMCQEIMHQIPRLVMDQNGNHVIQKIVEVMPTHSTFIIDAFIGRVAEFSVHAYGCRCVQRVLEHCKYMNEVTPVLDEILKGVETLVTDQYGNYVVQHVVINGHPRSQYAVTQLLKGYYSQLSTHKFASNVIEKMFEHAAAPVRMQMLEELTTKLRDDGVSGLVGAVMDQYGNYVMQKIFDFCDDTQKAVMVNHLRPNSTFLKRASFGKHFILRLEKQGYLSQNNTPLQHRHAQQPQPQHHQQMARQPPSPPHHGYMQPPQQYVPSPQMHQQHRPQHQHHHQHGYPQQHHAPQHMHPHAAPHPTSPQVLSPVHTPPQQRLTPPSHPQHGYPQQHGTPHGAFSPTHLPQRQWNTNSPSFTPSMHMAPQSQYPPTQPNWG